MESFLLKKLAKAVTVLLTILAKASHLCRHTFKSPKAATLGVDALRTNPDATLQSGLVNYFQSRTQLSLFKTHFTGLFMHKWDLRTTNLYTAVI